MCDTFKFEESQRNHCFRCQDMKMRTIKLTSKFLSDAIQGKAAAFATNLPQDVELLDVKFDLCSNQVMAVIRSNSFEDVAESCPIPEFKVNYAPAAKTASQPSSTNKIEPKPSPIFKPESSGLKKIETNRNQATNKIEEEFNPEQRKLLNFKIEGDYAIVKPTQFLKAEWEDINEVVKSLGGKWVKGDIISYWQVPLQN
jgi:hypothetical protein